jgi:hypothetical protein
MKSYLAFGVLGLFAFASAVGCGSSGPQGETGEAGPPGHPGSVGEAGARGPGFDGGGGGDEPTINGITPAQAFLGHSGEVSISGNGTNWTSVPTVDFGANVTVDKVTVATPTALVVDFTVDAAAALGKRDVKVMDGATTLSLTGAFHVLSPLVLTFNGNVAQGAIGLLNVGVIDPSTPLDTTNIQGYPLHLQASVGTGAFAIPAYVDDYSAIFQLYIDVTAQPGPQTFDLVSGPPGVAGSDVEFPAPQAVNIAARTPTAFSTTAVNGNLAAPYDSDVYSFTPASASLTILDFSLSTTSSTAAPNLYLLPTTGKWGDMIAQGAGASAGVPTTATYVSQQTTQLYAVVADTTGNPGPYTLPGVVQTTPACTKAATLPDTMATAIVATSLPFVLTDGDLSHNNNGGDWVKVQMPANKTTLRIQTSNNLNTDAYVALYDDGQLPVNSFDGTNVDFSTALPPGTYYVNFAYSPYTSPSSTTYMGIIRVE